MPSLVRSEIHAVHPALLIDSDAAWFGRRLSLLGVTQNEPSATL